MKLDTHSCGGEPSPRTSAVADVRPPRLRPGAAGAAASNGVEWNSRFGAESKRHASIRIVRNFGAPAERVFDAWLTPAVARLWLFATASRPLLHADIDRNVAGSFRLVDQRIDESVEYRGEYIEIIPYRRLAFTLRASDDPPAVTRVGVDIAPLRRGCALTLTHERVARAHVAGTRQRWSGMLYGLGVTLDLRGMDASAVPSTAGLALLAPDERRPSISG